MSDPIQHECGIAFIRLLKPLTYYQEKYGTINYGLNKLYLLMEKQRNRGQDGVGVASVKFNVEPGTPYLDRKRSTHPNPIEDVFAQIGTKIEEAKTHANSKNINDPQWQAENLPFLGNTYLGHLRYGTFGKNDISCCHPFLRENNWLTKNIAVAGNFNLTNVAQLVNTLIEIGQHPKEISDTVTMLEKIAHFLDKENDRLYKMFKKEGFSQKEISFKISEALDIQKVLEAACRKWDGGFCISGLIGNGDAFVLRDPWGIRPAFVYQDDEIVVVTSERAPIQTALNVEYDSIRELTPGCALIIKKDGTITEEVYRKQEKISKCSFERIYFSRGSDSDIYKERKQLGSQVLPQILDHIKGELEHTVFSFIPNTAESSFYGMMESLNDHHNKLIKEALMNCDPADLTPEFIDKLLAKRARSEKVAIKDAKLRTFITDDSNRDDLVAHVYDITYDSVTAGVDNLVVIDDSIVRGTTLRQSIIRILARLNPKRIVVVSSAPQIRYPDCYGIDMAKMGDFCAFSAAIELLKENHMGYIISEVYEKCKAQVGLKDSQVKNFVKEIYAPFTQEQVSDKISKMLTPPEVKVPVSIIFQSIEGLHKACPDHKGDWYFSGDYPTPGGFRVVNQAFINYVEGRNERAY
ncbi:MAG: amidophosphoribosyltransferase [Lentisphaeria bacterium]|nr:amidophosphoribosyltransferase [Lentisphaeria bacterium]